MRKLLALLLIAVQLFILISCVTDTPTPDEGKDQDGPHICSFTVQSPKAKYIKTRATCTERAQYYYSCSCGEMGTESFEYGEFAGHDYYLQSVIEKYLVKEATVKTSAVYYKSCKCGAVGTETFVHGTPIQLNKEQQALLPISLTVTLYDSLTYAYGFTYGTYAMPIDPVIEIKMVGDTEWTEYIPTTYETTTLDHNDTVVSYFVSKAHMTLLPDTEYVYRITDRGADVTTPENIIRTKNHSADSFTFAHVSDSQAGSTEFGRVMAAISDNADFVIHTGDVVQHAQYEYQWSEMLDGNYQYVAGMPIMPITGNHETSYNGTTYAIDNHFNNDLPEQESLSLGYYYSFTYGDVKFIMLNTNDLEDNKLKAEQYDWLISELESNTSMWTVVSMHNPMYSVGKYGADETRNAIALALRDQLCGVFAQYGVDLVLQAHDHAVSRTYPINGDGDPTAENTETVDGVEYIVDPDGVIYVMHGPAGTQQRSPVAIDEALYAEAEAGLIASWAEITVTADTLTVTVKHHTGATEKDYYTFGIKKEN
jgi:3',5'-cyclic AMP phosphodiesterase CpdA